MKRKLVAMLVLISLFSFSALWAEEKGEQGHGHSHHDDKFSSQDVYEMVPSLDGKTLSEVTTNELLGLAEKISIRQQEEAYIDGVTFASFVVPGTGQFITGNAGLGALQLTLHLGIVAGSLYGAYEFLPDDIKNATQSKAGIEAAFDNATFEELLPSLGFLAGGALLDGILSSWSASGARRAAEENVRSGKVTFEPDLRVNALGAFFGLGIGF